MSYVASWSVGILVGISYGLLGLRSPAPPVVALIGLLGMLAGESGVAFVKFHFFADRAAPVASAPSDVGHRS